MVTKFQNHSITINFDFTSDRYNERLILVLVNKGQVLFRRPSILLAFAVIISM